MASTTRLDKKKNSVTGVIKDEILSGYTRNVKFEETLEVKNVRVGTFKLSLYSNQQDYLEGVVTDIRFTGKADKTKNNNGTIKAIFKKSDGSTIFTLSGSSHYVCPTNGTKTHSVTEIDDKLKMYKEAYRVELTRKIDTSSNGWASMLIEFKVNGTWKTVLYTTKYRTGNGTETKTFDLTV